MATNNPNELARLRQRAESLAALDHVEQATVATIESVIAERDALKAQLQDTDVLYRKLAAELDRVAIERNTAQEERNTARTENAALAAEIERMRNQPQTTDGSGL